MTAFCLARWLRANRSSRAHADAGNFAIVDETERLAVSAVKQHDQPAPSARFDAVLFLCARAVAVRPGDDVGLHADGENAAGRAFRRAPPVVTRIELARHVHVETRAFQEFASFGLLKRTFENGNSLLNGENPAHDVVMDK